jgi:hypothetical protein
MFAIHTWKVHTLDHSRWVKGIRGILPHHRDVEGGVWARRGRLAEVRAPGHEDAGVREGLRATIDSKYQSFPESGTPTLPSTTHGTSTPMNPQNRTLPLPRLGFVVGLSIYASTPSDQERSMGWFPGGDRGTRRAARNGWWRDWERRRKGRGSKSGSGGVGELLLQMKTFRVAFAKLSTHRLFWNGGSTTFVSN